MALSIEYKESNKGRPRVDIETLLLKIFYDAPKGLNHEKLATFLDIAMSTFYDLKSNNSDFSEALKHYYRISPIEVLKSLKSIAVGYSADEVTKELKKQGNKFEMVTTKIVTKHFQPNAAAAQFYLKNQMSEEFKDKIETEHSVASNMESITFSVKRRET